MDLLDESKENIHPLKGGRNMSTLSTALQAQKDVDIYHQLMKEREQFEILVRSYSGDDPLKPWYDYVQWVEQNFPKHGKEGNLKVLLESCLAEFKEADQYLQDVRYIDLWARYMSFTENPLEMYKQIHARGIGANCAIFYQCWAEEYELANDMKRADQVYIEGIKRNAYPVDELMSAHTNFQVRVARNILGQNPMTNVERHTEERTALSTLRAHGRKRNMVDSTRVGTNIKHTTPGKLFSCSNNKSVDRRNGNSLLPKIVVYSDEMAPFHDAVSSTKVKSAVNVKQEQVNKENTLKPGRWNEGKFKKKISAASSGLTAAIPVTKNPTFHVHVDENTNIPRTPHTDIVASNVLKVRKHVYDDESSIPIAIFEPPDPKKIAVYPKNKVYCGGTEFSLEELRAIRYFKCEQNKKNTCEESECQMVSNNTLQSEMCDDLPVEISNSNGSKIHAYELINNFGDGNENQAVMENTKKQCFEVFVDEEEVGVKLRQNKSSLESFPKPKKIQPIVPVFPKELPFSGCLKVPKLLKEKKENMVCDEFVDCPTLSGSKECDQSLTVNTKAVLNEVKNMWLSSPPKHVEAASIPRHVISDENLCKTNTNCVAPSTSSVPFQIFSDTSVSLKPNSRINVYTDQEDKYEVVSKDDGIKDDVHREVMKEPHPKVNHQSSQLSLHGDRKHTGSAFNIYADSFTMTERQSESLPHTKIPFVPSPGMTPTQKAALTGTEDKENMQSEHSRKKLQFSSKKSNKGILEPSKDIYFVPLEQQFKEGEMDQENALSDETCNTEAFAKPLISSTPLTFPRSKHLDSELTDNIGPNDNTMCFINAHEIRNSTKSNGLNVADKKETGSGLVHPADNEAGLKGIQCLPQVTAVQATHLSTIYEMSENKKSRSLGESSNSKSSGIDTIQKYGNCSKFSSNGTKLHEQENAFKDLQGEFRLFCIGNKQNISSHEKIMCFFSDNLRDVKMINFSEDKLTGNCRKLSCHWEGIVKEHKQLHVDDGSYVIIEILSEHEGKIKLKARNLISGEAVLIEIKSYFHLWEVYIKEELRLRLKDPLMVHKFITKDCSYIFTNKIIYVSAMNSFKCLQTVLTEYHAKTCNVMEELDAAYLACEMLNMLFHLHKCHIVHGNITVNSFYFHTKCNNPDITCLFLNDFTSAVDVKLLPPNCVFDATEKMVFKKVNANKVSVYQVDYIAIADVLHHVIYNEPLNVEKRFGVWKVVTSLPRNFESSLWNFLFEELLNKTEVNLHELYNDLCKMKESKCHHQVNWLSFL